MMKISSKMWLTPVVALALFGGYAKAAEGGRHAAAFRVLPYAVLAVGTLSPYVPVAAAGANAASTKTAADEDKEGIHQHLRGEQKDASASVEASFGSWRSDDITHHRSLAKGGGGGNECVNLGLDVSKTVQSDFVASKNRINVGKVMIVKGEENGTFQVSATLKEGCSIDGLHVDVVDGGSLPGSPKPGQMPCKGPAPLTCNMADFNADCCAQSRNMFVHASIQCDERVPGVGVGSAYAGNFTEGSQDSSIETTQWFNYMKDIPMTNDIRKTSCDTGLVVSASCGCVNRPYMEFKVVKEVKSSAWITVALSETYVSPIVVCTVKSDTGPGKPAVVRMQNVEPTSFKIRLQKTLEEDLEEVHAVHCLVVEEGDWNLPSGGKIEAKMYLSTVTDSKDSWVGKEQKYSNEYTKPVVLGQVMTYNDDKWSAFWSRGSTKDDAPSDNVMFTGKHVGGDTEKTRADETIGYVVIESGDTISGKIEIKTGRGEAKGNDEASDKTTFDPSFSTVPAVAVLSQVGMMDEGGSWAVLQEITSMDSMKVTLHEDDGGREHGMEKFDYIVVAAEGAAGSVQLMQPASCKSVPTKCGSGLVWRVSSCECVGASVEFMVVKEVKSSAWKTVTLSKTYASPIAVCTVEYDAGSDKQPAVVRMQNVGPTSFDIRLQNPLEEDLEEARDVHCLVVEEGKWNLLSGGKIEAKKYLSTVTDSKDSWIGEERRYSNEYSNKPVVLGQVMTYNDTQWSAFWSRGSTKDDAPSDNVMFIGKHVGGDTNKTRADETIGYVVIESESTTSGEIEIKTGRGKATGVPLEFDYFFSDIPAVAVLSQVGMNDTDGSWAVLKEITSINSMKVAVDREKIVVDHDYGTELLDYVVFAAEGSMQLTLPNECTTVSTKSCIDGGRVTDANCDCVPASMEFKVVGEVTSSAWKSVKLSESFVSPIPVCTVQYDAGETPLLPTVVRMRNVGRTSFEIRLQNPKNIRLQGARDVHCVVVEEGKWTMPEGPKIEAKKYLSTVTDSKDSWIGEKRMYSNEYTKPVVLGQVMSYNDTQWSVFWSSGSDQTLPTSDNVLSIGKHVGGDKNKTRAAETIGYIVMDSGDATSGMIKTGRGEANGYDVTDRDTSLRYTFDPSFTVAVLSQVSMMDTYGSWSVLLKSPEKTSMMVAVDKDQFVDDSGPGIENFDYVMFTAEGSVQLNPLVVKEQKSDSVQKSDSGF